MFDVPERNDLECFDPGSATLCEEVPAQTQRDDPETIPVTDALDLMTPRQLELLALIASGYDMQEVGAMKFISPHTVRNVLYGARDKVGARNLTHLAVLAADRGLLERNGIGYVPVVEERSIS